MPPDGVIKKTAFISLSGWGGGAVRIRADLIRSFKNSDTHRAVLFQHDDGVYTLQVKNSLEDIENRIREAWRPSPPPHRPPVFIDISKNTRIKAEDVCAALGPEGTEPLTKVYVAWGKEERLKTTKTPEEIEKLVNDALQAPPRLLPVHPPRRTLP